MAQIVFKRHEKKCLLIGGQCRRLMLVLNGVTDMDVYGRYTIRNIYLDIPDYELIHTSIEKPVYKEEVRLRCYGGSIDDSSTVFVKIKKKFESVVYRRRVEMSLETARKYLYYGVEPKEEGQILKEVDYTVKRYGLKPMAYTSYERTVYTCQMDRELRVTFDQNILGRLGELDLRVEPYGKCLLPQDMALMETKIMDAMPVWFSRILVDSGIFPASYSKYGTFYGRYTHPMLTAAIEEENGGYSGRTQYEQGGLICA